MREYLITLDELNHKEKTEQQSLFKDDNIFDVIHQCPICKRKRQHLDWWTCKECSHLPIDIFIKELIKYFG